MTAGCSNSEAVTVETSAAPPPTTAPVTMPPHMTDLLPGMPPPLSPTDIYAADRELSPVVAEHRPLVYVPNSKSSTVTVIDQNTFQVVDSYSSGGEEPQHVVPSYDLRTLYATNDLPIGGGSLLPIDPRTGAPAGPAIPVRDPYNMYYTPLFDRAHGRHAVTVRPSAPTTNRCTEARPAASASSSPGLAQPETVAVPSGPGVTPISATSSAVVGTQTAQEKWVSSAHCAARVAT